MKKQYWSKRTFLNKEGYHSTAVISTYIENHLEEGNDYIMWGEWAVSNCDRSLSLSIDLETLEGLDNTVHKMERIVEVSNSFKEEILRLRPLLEKYLDEKKKDNTTKEDLDKLLEETAEAFEEYENNDY